MSESSPARQKLDDAAVEARNRQFEAIAMPCLPAVTRYASMLTRDAGAAAELAQDTFTQAFLHWHQFREGSACRPWLYTICRNIHLRSQERARRFVDPGDTEGNEPTPTISHGWGRSSGLDRLVELPDVGPAIASAIASLSPPFRETVILVDVNDLSYEEAAEVLVVPVGTVRSRLFRARRLLQEQLRQHALDLGILSPTRVNA